MRKACKSLAESIATEPGLLWAICAENARKGEAGGIDLFGDQASAEADLAMHTARLPSFGVQNIRGRLSNVSASLSAVDRAPL